MAYGLRYTCQAIAKTEPTQIVYTAEIYEKDFVGSSETFDAALHPFTLQVLANSDDIFDVILPTTLNLLVDVTDFAGTLPDFTTTDDRKYWVKFYGDGTTYNVWQGFILMDQVTIPFTTGRIFFQMVCVDGLAMLKSITYQPTDLNVNVLEDLSTTITNCLNKIELPDGYNLNYLCDYYSSSMDVSKSPFKQSYLPPRNYLNTDGRTYQSCYDVLTKILRGFGCKIFQSNGEWWIAAINNQCSDQIRYFTTTNANGVESITTRWKQREILPYENVTDTPFYFQDNVQTKILRKGYPYLYLYSNYAYASNCISDPWLEQSSLATYWVMGYSGTGSNIIVQQWVPAKMNAFTLTRGSGFAQVAPIQLPIVPSGEIIDFTFDVFQSELSGGNRLFVKMTINDGTGTDWYLDIDKQWSKAPSLNYYNIGAYTGASSANSQEKITITTTPIPAQGQLTMYLRVDSGTMNSIIIGNFILTMQSQYERDDIRNFELTDTTISYRKDVEIFVGEESPTDVNAALNGLLVDSSGALLFEWTTTGDATVYPYLMNLVYQQYYNVFALAQINFNLTVRNLFDSRNNIGPIVKQYPHIIGLIDTINVNDTTGTTLSVNGVYFLTGAAEFNYTEDVMNGTVLCAFNTKKSVTPINQIIYKS